MNTALIAATIKDINSAVEMTKSISDFKKYIDDKNDEIKLTDIVDILAEAKQNVLKICRILEEKEREVMNLRRIFSDNDNYVELPEGIYRKDENGVPTGKPICFKCWESSSKIDLLENLYSDHQKNASEN
jgi:hypothetical protein